MNFIKELSEFYKHCMNVGTNCRKTYYGPLYFGWCRLKFSPYLTNSKVIFTPSDSFSEYIDAVKDTIDDYKIYINCISVGISKDTNNKLDLILQGLKLLNNKQLINLIEKETDKFPTEEDYNNNWVLKENFNNMCKKGVHYKHLLKV
jgi:hypothetical protein